jgi:hypothetical protein
MPQARSSGSRSTSGGGGAKRSTTRSSAKAGTSRSSGGRAASGGRSAGARSAGSRSTGTRSASAVSGAESRFEAEAQRLRKLNERIIEAGRGAGETTLSSYEKVLKTIASTLERGPGSSDVEWISSLATAQAKFIRDVTDAWTSAARKMISQ